MKDSVTFWNHRSKGYDTQVGPLYAAAYEKTIAKSLVYLKEGDQVLDFACGTGAVTLPVARRVASVTAIDISDRMLAQALEKAEREGLGNITFRLTSLFDEALPTAGFDAVLACNVLCYLPEPQRELARIHALLKPGGVFLSATDCLGGSLTRVAVKKWWRSHTGAMPFAAFYRVKQLEQLIAQNGFDVLETEDLFGAPPNLFVAARRRALSGENPAPNAQK